MDDGEARRMGAECQKLYTPNLSCISDTDEIYYLASPLLHLKHPEVSLSVLKKITEDN